MDFHRQNDWFIQHFFKMLRFNVMDIHECPSMAMTLSAGLYGIVIIYDRGRVGVSGNLIIACTQNMLPKNAYEVHVHPPQNKQRPPPKKKTFAEIGTLSHR